MDLNRKTQWLECNFSAYASFALRQLSLQRKGRCSKRWVGLHSGPFWAFPSQRLPGQLAYNPTNEQCCPRAPSFLTYWQCSSLAYPSDKLAPMLWPLSSVPWVLQPRENTHLIHSLCPGCSSIIILTTPYYHNSNIIIIVIATLNVSLFSHQFTMNDSMISILWWRELRPRGVKEIAQGHRASEWWPLLRT